MLNSPLSCKPTVSQLIHSSRLDPNGEGIDLNAEKAVQLAWD